MFYKLAITMDGNNFIYPVTDINSITGAKYRKDMKECVCRYPETISGTGIEEITEAEYDQYPKCRVNLDKTQIQSDGVDAVTITVSLPDAIVGEQVSLSVNGAIINFTLTDTNQAVFTYTNTVPGSVVEITAESTSWRTSDKNINKSRDPKFREKVLCAYEYKCAVCGFNVRLRNKLIAVEAAHIKWHQAGGPNSENNGIALCSMHHKLFDHGVFTLTNSGKLLVAEKAHGTNGFENWLLQYHGKIVRKPIRPEYKPKDLYVNWHIREVFKGPSRYYIG